MISRRHYRSVPAAPAATTNAESTRPGAWGVAGRRQLRRQIARAEHRSLSSRQIVTVSSSQAAAQGPRMRAITWRRAFRPTATPRGQQNVRVRVSPAVHRPARRSLFCGKCPHSRRSYRTLCETGPPPLPSAPQEGRGETHRQPSAPIPHPASAGRPASLCRCPPPFLTCRNISVMAAVCLTLARLRGFNAVSVCVSVRSFGE